LLILKSRNSVDIKKCYVMADHKLFVINLSMRVWNKIHLLDFLVYMELDIMMVIKMIVVEVVKEQHKRDIAVMTVCASKVINIWRKSKRLESDGEKDKKNQFITVHIRHVDRWKTLIVNMPVNMNGPPLILTYHKTLKVN
jgi:hypothetical protein